MRFSGIIFNHHIKNNKSIQQIIPNLTINRFGNLIKLWGFGLMFGGLGSLLSTLANVNGSSDIYIKKENKKNKEKGDAIYY